MNYFALRDGELWGEAVSLIHSRNNWNNLCYVYSQAALEEGLAFLLDTCYQLPHQINYAVKANSNLAAEYLGSVWDRDLISSLEGELERVLAAGTARTHCIFRVGKSPRRTENARLEMVGVLISNRRRSFIRLSEIAQQIGKTSSIAIRVNPDVSADSHPYISTGLKEISLASL